MTAPSRLECLSFLDAEIKAFIALGETKVRLKRPEYEIEIQRNRVRMLKACKAWIAADTHGEMNADDKAA